MKIEPQNTSEKWVLAGAKASKRNIRWVSCTAILLFPLIFMGVGFYFWCFRYYPEHDFMLSIPIRIVVGFSSVCIGVFCLIIGLMVTLIWYERRIFSKIIDGLLSLKNDAYEDLKELRAAKAEEANAPSSPISSVRNELSI